MTWSNELQEQIDRTLKMGDDIKKGIIRDSIDRFHIKYEEDRIWNKTSWLGVPCWKLPFDAFVIQELIFKLKPDWIIETGTGKGGSAMFYASICELMNKGKIITVDIENVNRDCIRDHKWSDRINFIKGSSVDNKILNRIKDIIGYSKNNMVILDSWHTRDHVYREMLLYSRLVPVGGYMIVEDSHANGNPVPWKWNDEGPMGAIDLWMKGYGGKWEIDEECEKHLMTFNPRGYLRRTKNGDRKDNRDI